MTSPHRTSRERFLHQLTVEPEAALVHDLDHPDFNPPDCPAWAKEDLPEHINKLRGRRGQPHPYRTREHPLALTVLGVDRYHANQFIIYRPETEKFLYEEYTPLTVSYRKGLLPAFENLAAEVTEGCQSDTEKAVALLKQGVSRVKHPDGAPCGPYVLGNRNLSDDELLASGVGWCNEQARVFIRLCQVSDIPARLVHLFYSTEKTGHCVAEFYADGQWSLADATWLCVFPDENGNLLSAAECHDSEAGLAILGRVYFQRWQELLALSDAELNRGSAEKNAEFRKKIAIETPESLAQLHYHFALINYPLPQ